MENTRKEEISFAVTVCSQLTTQNKAIESAIQELKSLTHSPAYQIPNTGLNKDALPFYGFNTEDLNRIREFIDFLERKKTPISEITNYIINNTTL